MFPSICPSSETLACERRPVSGCRLSPAKKATAGNTSTFGSYFLVEFSHNILFSTNVRVLQRRIKMSIYTIAVLSQFRTYLLSLIIFIFSPRLKIRKREFGKKPLIKRNLDRCRKEMILCIAVTDLVSCVLFYFCDL